VPDPPAAGSTLTPHENSRHCLGEHDQCWADCITNTQSCQRWFDRILADHRHLDEVFLRINGELQYLWRAVDQGGDVLDVLQSRRNKQAGKKFFCKLLKGLQYVPRAIVTDKPRSYAAATAEVMPSVDHDKQKRLNNREQPGGEFLPAYPRTRTPHARVRISRAGANIPFDLWGDSVVFPSWPTFTDTSALPRDHAPPLHTMA
jgi:hypothetical protein